MGSSLRNRGYPIPTQRLVQWQTTRSVHDTRQASEGCRLQALRKRDELGHDRLAVRVVALGLWVPPRGGNRRPAIERPQATWFLHVDVTTGQLGAGGFHGGNHGGGSFQQRLGEHAEAEQLPTGGDNEGGVAGGNHLATSAPPQRIEAPFEGRAVWIIRVVVSSQKQRAGARDGSHVVLAESDLAQLH